MSELNAAIYIRTPRTVADPEDSVERQREAIREYLATKGWEEVGVFHDIIDEPSCAEGGPGLCAAIEAAGVGGNVVVTTPEGGAHGLNIQLTNSYLAIHEAGATVRFGTVPDGLKRIDVLGLEMGIHMGFAFYQTEDEERRRNHARRSIEGRRLVAQRRNQPNE